MVISQHLKRIQEKLPTWFKMRRKADSVGAQFLNVFGFSFDDVKDILDYAYRNQFLPTADIDQVDIVYKAVLPAGLKPEMLFDFTTELFVLQPAPNLEQFLTALVTDKLNYSEVYYENPYYVDLERNLVYVRRSYDIGIGFPEGKLSMRIMDKDNRLILQDTLKLQLHHIWNFFDEFGLILDTPRLYAEPNAEYKIRLLDVFRHPANSSERGLYNALARELGLTKVIEWEDGGKDLILQDARVRPQSIEVNGIPWPQSSIYIDSSKRVILRGEASADGISQTVTYLYGITMHELHDKGNTAFRQELFDIDGHATAMLQYYVDMINHKVPTNWGQFVWGVGYWDAANPDSNGDGVVPSFYDANISDWSKYKTT